jgi:CRP/FNR family transcriptional regulator, cyclic AMP receptor protein
MRGPSAICRPAGSLLAGFDLFASLSEDALGVIENACTSRRYAREEQIIDRDSRSRDVLFVISGRAKMLNYSVSGREIVLDDLIPGSSFGEIGAIDDQPRLAEVVAIDDVLLTVIPQLVFLQALKAHPQVAVSLMRRLARTVRAADERIMDLSTLAAHERVYAEVLRRAQVRMIGDNTAEIVPIPLHSEIASKTSTTRETVARAISNLARRGIVSRAKTALCVHDIHALRQIVARVRP